MTSPDLPNDVFPFVDPSNVVGTSLQLNFPNQGDPTKARCPLSLRARTWPEGKRIDLVWQTPSDVTRVVLKRSQSGHSAFINDDSEIIYNGAAISQFIDGVPLTTTIGAPIRLQQPPTLEVGVPSTGIALNEDTFYYYTVYMTSAADPIGILDFGEAKELCQVTGLSIPDYFAQTGLYGGNALYRSFDEKSREKDQEQAAATGLTTGLLEDFSRFLQGTFNLYRGYTQALEKLGNPSKMPAGLVGDAFDQASILKAYVRRFNIIPERFILDVNVLRRLAESFIFFVKEKGTCAGIQDFVKIITTWDSTCVEVVNITQGFFLETWDGQSQCLAFSFPLSLVTLAPGSVFVPGGLFTPDLFDNGLFISGMGDVFTIDDNTADSIIFEDTTALPVAEDVGTIGAPAGLVIPFTPTDAHSLNDGEYDGMQLIDSTNTVFSIVSTDGVANTVTISAGVPTAGAGAIAPVYIVGATFAARDPQFIFRVYHSGSNVHTFLHEALKDLSLTNEIDLLYTGGTLQGVPFNPQDVIVTIAAGIASFTGELGPAFTITTITMTDDDADFGPDNTLIGFFLNPNRNQTQLWEIVSNTKTSVTVTLPSPSVTLDLVAGLGSDYFILDRIAARRYQQITRLLAADLVVPPDSKAFVFFN